MPPHHLEMPNSQLTILPAYVLVLCTPPLVAASLLPLVQISNGDLPFPNISPLIGALKLAISSPHFCTLDPLASAPLSTLPLGLASSASLTMPAPHLGFPVFHHPFAK